MSFRTYQEGLQQATDLASKAIQIESSLSALTPLASPIPTLQKAFPIYISSAEAYSHLLSSSLVPPHEVSNIKKKWRLVLERAEKIKARIEASGDQVGKVEVDDQGEEAAVLRRGGSINGVDADLWVEPPSSSFRSEVGIGTESVSRYKDRRQPELAEEQLVRNPIWKESPPESWEDKNNGGNEWVMRQGPVSDCSVVAAMGVELEHNRQFGTNLAWSSLYPQGRDRRPQRSENGRHVLKLLLNGSWRSVVFDALLPHASADGSPLYTTCHTSSDAPSASVGAPWAPLALKGYFKVFGGYSLRGSNPAPDIYAFTGWIPERLSLKEGFQREKEWKRLLGSWKKGEVMVSLGTGEIVGEGLVRLHAYGVIGLREEGDERLLEVFDPGAAVLTMSWDQVCSEFEALHLNWKPELIPVVATRHWSWHKPVDTSTAAGSSVQTMSNPQYRLRVSSPARDLGDVWLLLSQHITSRDRPLDDIALHVFEEYVSTQTPAAGRVIHPHRANQASPYANSLHVLVKHPLRRSQTDLLIVPARDRGNFQTGFTLQAFSPAGSALSLTRISRTLPFSHTVNGTLNSRNAGGHPGWFTHLINPQYAATVQKPPRGGKGTARITLQGEKELAWNVKLLWGKGELVTDVSEDMVLADTGSYSYGMAYCDLPEINPGTYTLIVSAFEPSQTGPFTLTMEGTAPIALTPIPAEGAGMFSRIINGRWTDETAGGRPSSGGYERNPRIEVILPRPGTILSRLSLPNNSSSNTPINLTVFRRDSSGRLGSQITTTGPYSDLISGVSTGKHKFDQGVYLFVPSTFEPFRGSWQCKIWSDVPISAELQTD